MEKFILSSKSHKAFDEHTKEICRFFCRGFILGFQPYHIINQDGWFVKESNGILTIKYDDWDIYCKATFSISNNCLLVNMYDFGTRD